MYRSVQADVTRSCQQHARAPRQAQQRPTQRSIFARAADHGPYICRSKSSHIAIKRNIIMFAAKRLFKCEFCIPGMIDLMHWSR